MPSSLGGASEFVDKSNFQMFPFLKWNSVRSCYLFVTIVLRRDHWSVWEVTKSLSYKGQEMSLVGGREGVRKPCHFCGSHLGAGCHDNIVKYIQIRPQSLLYCSWNGKIYIYFLILTWSGSSAPWTGHGLPGLYSLLCLSTVEPLCNLKASDKNELRKKGKSLVPSPQSQSFSPALFWLRESVCFQRNVRLLRDLNLRAVDCKVRSQYMKLFASYANVCIFSFRKDVD